MRKKSITLVIVIAAILTLLLGFAACTPNNNKNNEINTETLAFRDALNHVMEAVGLNNGLVNLNAAVTVDTSDGKKYDIKAIMNLKEKGSNASVTVNDENGGFVGALYIINDRLYLDLANGKKLLLEDVTADLIIEKLSNMPDYDQLMGGLEGLIGMNLGLGDMLLAMMCADGALITANGTRETLTMDIAFGTMINSLLDLVKSLNIDELLAGLGVQLPGSLATFIGTVNIPSVDARLEMVTDNGKAESTKIFIIEEDEALYNFDIAIDISANELAIAFPDDLANYQPFSLTNFSFTADLALDSNSVNIANLVGLFVATDKIPDNLVLTSDIGFTLRVRVDLDPDDNNKNLINIELFERGKTSPLAGVYFINGRLLINLDSAVTYPGGGKIPNIAVDDINLSAYVKDIAKMMTDAIDSAMASFADTDTAMVMAVAASSGEAVLAPDVISFAKALAMVVGFDEFVKVSQDSINILFNKDMVDALKTLVGTLELDVPNGFNLNVAINLASYGIDNIDIKLDAQNKKFNAGLNIHDFYIGYTDVDLAEDTLRATQDKDYASNVADIIFNVLKGMELNAELDINFRAGAYSIKELLALFDLKIPELDMVFTQDMKLDASIRAQFALNNDDPATSKMLIEIIANEDFMYGKKGKLLGFYYENHILYADLSGIVIANIRMPKLKAEVNLAKMLIDEINKLDYDLVLNGGQATATHSVRTVSDTMLSDLIDIGINMDAFVFKATGAALSKVLKSLDIDVELPNFDITGELNAVEGIKIAVTGDASDAGNYLTADLTIPRINFGNEISVTISNDLKIGSYDNVVEALISLLYNIDFEGSIDITTGIEKIDIRALVNNILAPSGKYITNDITLDTREYNESIFIKLKWNLIKGNTDASTLLLEIYTHDSMMLSVYGKDGILYIDLSGVGLMKISAADTDYANLIINAVNGVDLSQFNLTDMINGLFEQGEISELPSVDGGDADAGATIDLLAVLIANLNVTDTTIGLQLVSEAIKEVLLAGYIDLGYDVDASINLDIATGKLNMSFGLSHVRVDVGFDVYGLGAAGEPTFDGIHFNSFAALNNTDIDAFVNSFIESLQLDIDIDMFMNSVDTSDNRTRINIKKVNEDTSLSGADGNAIARKNSILITLYNGFVSSNAWIYISLDFNTDTLGIYGTTHWFANKYLGVVDITGSMIALSFPDIGIKTMLYDMVAGLFPEIPRTSDGGAAAVAAYNLQQDNSDALGIIKSIAISLKKYGVINVGLSMDGAAMQTTVAEFINGIFTDLDISEMVGKLPGLEVVNIKYNATDSNKFYNDLWNNALGKIIGHEVDKAIADMGSTGALANKATIVGYIKAGFDKLICKLLPLPDFNELYAELEIIDSNLDNMRFNLLKRNADGTLDTSHSLNAYIFNRNAFDNVDWGAQDNNIIIDGSSADLLSGMFMQYATRKTAGNSLDTQYEITWQLKNADGTFTDFVYNDMSIFIDADSGKLKAGKYDIYGYAGGDTVNVKLTVIGDESYVTGVEDVYVGTLENVPDTVTVRLADGSTKTVHGVTINVDRSIIDETVNEPQTVVGTVTVYGVEHSVNVVFENAYIRPNIETVNISAYDYKEFIKGFDLNMIEAVIGSGAIRLATVTNIDWRILTDADMTVLLKGGVFNIPITLDFGGNVICETYFYVNMACKEVDSIMLNSGANAVSVLPKFVGREYFPNSALVFYTDGSSEEIEVSWNTANTKFDLNGNITTAIVSNKEGDIIWEHTVDVYVLDIGFQGIVYGDGVDAFVITAFDYANYGLPTHVTIATAYGEFTLAAEFDVDSIISDTNIDKRLRVKVRINEGDYIGEIIYATVEINKINVLAIDENIVNIDLYNVIYGGATIESAFKDKLLFNTDLSDTPVALRVTWSGLDAITLNIEGGVYTVKASIKYAGISAEYDVTVNAADLTLSTAYDSMEISLEQYRNDPSSYFGEKAHVMLGGIECDVKVYWDTADTVFTVGEISSVRLILGLGTKYEQSVTVVVSVAA